MSLYLDSIISNFDRLSKEIDHLLKSILNSEVSIRRKHTRLTNISRDNQLSEAELKDGNESILAHLRILDSSKLLTVSIDQSQRTAVQYQSRQLQIAYLNNKYIEPCINRIKKLLGSIQKSLTSPLFHSNIPSNSTSIKPIEYNTYSNEVLKGLDLEISQLNTVDRELAEQLCQAYQYSETLEQQILDILSASVTP